MTIKPSILAAVLGLALALPQLYGLAKPSEFAAAVRKFPRSVPWGVALMLLGTVWFLVNLDQESIADFAAYKTPMMAGFAIIGVGACIFVQDFLAVRGLAVVLLLLAKLMLDSGRPLLEAKPWVRVIQAWAYVMVVLGIWLTISPWRLRDWLNWANSNEQRVRVGSAIRLGFGLFVAVVGLAKL
jgi:hypothetical protein